MNTSSDIYRNVIRPKNQIKSNYKPHERREKRLEISIRINSAQPHTNLLIKYRFVLSSRSVDVL